ncbi:MAG: carbohydrate binding family 9 domain-containing protein [Verrucomicrobia bacterium]|nr:carbohydrate binding family 9 domain-containing protein [Verrucomicrobiota bacterium]
MPTSLHHRLRLACALALLAGTGGIGARAALPGIPSLAVHPTAVPPVIDGRLDDPAWRDAAHSLAFRQIAPLENAEPTERTEFWVTFDANHLYVAVRCHDAAGPAGLRAYSMQHDQDNGSDDLVRVVLDTFHRENDGYYFALTAAGGKHDGLIQNKAEANDTWDGLWTGRVSRDAGGWSAEFAIPLKTLSFNPANDAWGFNVARTIRRKQETDRWAGFIRNKPVTSLPDLGVIRGLRGLEQGHGVELRPFASVTRHSAPAEDEHEYELKPGLDVVWHWTPSLAATVTINTDFADAEVDERLVNLGRFDLFYPEKRSFFTQDASLFTFGGIVDEVTKPFFSRRIGLGEDGTKVDVLGGGKITGRAGPLTIGVLDTQVASHAGVPSRNLFVGRAAVQVLDESSVGLIATNGDPRAPTRNQVLGFDFNYRNSHVAGNKSLEVHAYAIGSDSVRAGGRDTDIGLSTVYSNEPLEFVTDWRRIGERFDPALGFVPRPGIYETYNYVGYTWRPVGAWFRRALVSVQPFYTLDLKGRVVGEETDLPYIELENAAGDIIAFLHAREREQFDTPFEIVPGVTVPVGDYRWNRFVIQYKTTRSRPVSADLKVRRLGLYDGDRYDYFGSLEWRASARFSTSASWQYSDIRLPGGHFPVRVSSTRFVYTHSPDLQFSLLGQYDNLSQSLGVNARIRWIVAPGDEFFLVVNQGYDAASDRLRPVENDTVLKGAWTYRF